MSVHEDERLGCILQDIIDMVESGDSELKLKAHLPPDRLRGKSINGVKAIELGVDSIMYMREYMMNKEMPQDLVAKVRAGAQSSS